MAVCLGEILLKAGLQVIVVRLNFYTFAKTI
nr:MAG TPA: hypothetical protein [Caudoviricetes sp.]